jgi:integrase/recombinase XerD
VIKGFRDFLIAKGKLPHTCDSYCRDAKHFLNFCSSHSLPLSFLSPQTLEQYQNHLKIQEHQKSNSIRRGVIGVRQFFRYLEYQKTIQSTPFDESPIPERLEFSPPCLNPDSVEEIFREISSSSSHLLKIYRDGAIVALLAYEGIKASELISLKMMDYLPQKGFSSLRISGHRKRLIQLSADSHQLLKGYTSAAKSNGLFNLSGKESLFVSFRGKDETIINPRLSRHGLKFMLYEIGKRVGITKLNTEILRHHAIAYLKRTGKSQEEVMAHLGLRQAGNIAKHGTGSVPEE